MVNEHWVVLLGRQVQSRGFRTADGNRLLDQVVVQFRWAL